ncbi:adenylyl-sulfate kinase [Trinickia fusca]|uniref:adenylyl-sulfate kinase n=1 Tax=Trinickia fusca TaxID=2419777 RepID=UPI00319E0E94
MAVDFSQGGVLWLTGLPGSGKSTIARALHDHLRGQGFDAVVLDGDALRAGLNADLGFSAVDRTENLRRMAHVAALFQQQGFIAIVAAISPLRAHRDDARRIAGTGFVEIFVDAPLEICEARDPKGLYRRARLGEIPEFTGIDAPYEAPGNPDIRLPTQTLELDECVQVIVDALGLTRQSFAS